MLNRSPHEPPNGLRRVLLSALGILLIGIQLAAIAHVHHEARETTSCALCAVAHTPAIDTAPTPPLDLPRPLEITFWVPTGETPEAPPATASSARAPPLA